MNICRYLAPFQPKHVAHYFTDVLVVGGGLAGLRAANSVDPRLSVLVVTKDRLLQSNSTYAQGGIAGVLGPDDEFEHHVEDTLAAGGGLCDVEVTNMVVREGPKRIAELVDWGTRFDKQGGELVLGREGGHSRFRVVHALGDATGKEVMRAVIQWTRNQDNVQIWENAFTLDLFSHEGRCRGAMACSRDGGMRQIWAKETILCTGGAGQLYRESTNPSVATADGHAMAYRAGAELRDMEFVQFHPTVLYIAGSGRSLITEAIRGEGGRLVDRDNVRFMSQYDSREELAPRDVVAQAIVCQMDKTRHPCVFLDLSHLDPDFVKRRFPGIATSCAKFGLDITTDQTRLQAQQLAANLGIPGVFDEPFESGMIKLIDRRRGELLALLTGEDQMPTMEGLLAHAVDLDLRSEEEYRRLYCFFVVESLFAVVLL